MAISTGANINGVTVTFSAINAVLQYPSNFSAAAAAHNVTQFVQDAVSVSLEDTFENQHGITLFVPNGEFRVTLLEYKLMQEIQMPRSPLPMVPWPLYPLAI